jgi:hypothetical protein
MSREEQGEKRERGKEANRIFVSYFSSSPHFITTASIAPPLLLPARPGKEGGQ